MDETKKTHLYNLRSGSPGIGVFNKNGGLVDADKHVAEMKQQHSQKKRYTKSRTSLSQKPMVGVVGKHGIVDEDRYMQLQKQAKRQAKRLTTKPKPV